MSHSLQRSDRDALQKSASTVSTHASVGSLVGVTLGIFLAYRLRANRAAVFRAFKASEKPTAVKFANGREEAIPDVTPMMKPSTLGDIATYTLLGAGGLFFGGETGLLTGSFRARQQINADRASRERIETAFRRYGPNPRTHFRGVINYSSQVPRRRTSKAGRRVRTKRIWWRIPIISRDGWMCIVNRESNHTLMYK